MSEHPITEQMLAEKNATGHSIFGPSSAHRWMRCPASLIQGHLAGDRPTIYAAEGSVAHWLAEDWLINGNPYRHLGTIHEKDGFEIEITDEMISYTEEYVGWVSTTPGRHYVEVRVDLSAYTPVPSFGTSDHIFVDDRHLIVTDFKYGKVIVDAHENHQGMCYALGAFDELDWLYDFDKITVRICQPRREHFDEFTFGRDRMLEFGEEVRTAAHAAWDPEAPYKPHPDACEYCPVRTTCPALTKHLLHVAQDAFEDFDDEVSVETALATIEQPVAGVPRLPDYRELPLAQLAAIYEWRPILEKWFREAYDYLLMQLELGEDVPGQKLGKGRAGNRAWIDQADARRFLIRSGADRIDLFNQKFISPNQAGELLRTIHGGSRKANNEKLADLVYSPPGKPTMIPAADKREALPSAVSAFDDLDEG